MPELASMCRGRLQEVVMSIVIQGALGYVRLLKRSVIFKVDRCALIANQLNRYVM